MQPRQSSRDAEREGAPPPKQKKQPAVLIKIRHDARHRRTGSDETTASFVVLASHYHLMEPLLDRPWFDRKIVRNPRTDCTRVSPVAELCGIKDLVIYFRADEGSGTKGREQQEAEYSNKSSSSSGRSGKNNSNSDCNHFNTYTTSNRTQSKSKPHSRKRVRRSMQSVEQHQRTTKHKPRGCHKRAMNALATLLTFDPDTGLYGRLIRGNAYVVIGGLEGDREIQSAGKTESTTNQKTRDLDAFSQARIVRDLTGLIFEHKAMYHKWGADFSQEGLTRLLSACAEYRNQRRAAIQAQYKADKDGTARGSLAKEPRVQQPPEQTPERKPPGEKIESVQSPTRSEREDRRDSVPVEPLAFSLQQEQRQQSSLPKFLGSGASTTLAPGGKRPKSDGSPSDPEHEQDLRYGEGAIPRKILHRSSTFDTSCDSSSDDAYSLVVESFEQKADDILISFEDEIHSLFPPIHFVHWWDDAEATAEGVPTFRCAFRTDEHNGAAGHPGSTPEAVLEQSTTQTHRRRSSSSSSSEMISRDLHYEADNETDQDQEQEHPAHLIDSITDDPHETNGNGGEKSKHTQNHSLFVGESHYPSSHLDTVFGMSHHLHSRTGRNSNRHRAVEAGDVLRRRRSESEPGAAVPNAHRYYNTSPWEAEPQLQARWQAQGQDQDQVQPQAQNQTPSFRKNSRQRFVPDRDEAAHQGQAPVAIPS
eukprot:CAMPEP_0172363448 /NCGR_PEP_ID=MMETSP1060-20121228/6805_1 /TAXON_ID=37318 /ORGANISM="Pseudo-nitzschia pungens, Strain cf. cingulata" /LENGTH=702 /DNA_ID=CAMNT_0013086191 /DNA_START=171 /DNA_END=2276 /DNA_ORIENTATION=-